MHTPAYDDLVKRHFNADAPNHLWLGDIERHEALLNREEVKDLLLQPGRSGLVKLEAA